MLVLTIGSLFALHILYFFYYIFYNQRLWKRFGHDHIVIFGTTIYHLLGVKVEQFLNKVCLNCTTLAIETSPSFAYTRAAASGDRSRRTKKRWFAVPYPSSFHWTENIKRLPWTHSVPRDIFAFCIGSIRTLTASSTKLRYYDKWILAYFCRRLPMK